MYVCVRAVPNVFVLSFALVGLVFFLSSRGIEIFRRVPLMDPVGPESVHAESSLNGLPCFEGCLPPLHIGVGFELQKLGRVVPLVEAPHPGENRHVGNRVLVAAHVLPALQVLFEDVDDPLGLHGEPVDRVFDLEGSVLVKVSESAAEIRTGAHLPHEPVHALGALATVGRQEFSLAFGQVEQNGRGFPYRERVGVVLVLVLGGGGGGCNRIIQQRGDLRVGIDVHKGRSELLQLENVDEPGVVLQTEFLEQYSDLLAVGSPERVELQVVLAAGQFRVEALASGRPVHAVDLAAHGFRFPYGGNHVALGIGEGGRFGTRDGVLGFLVVGGGGGG
mmetsp:Transcript_9583/g.28614  ORF Transcript_9583/g.28614 Transcript_9583/m.28614 type:complete len:334 (-) Transcript_9583:157-1158(-)